MFFLMGIMPVEKEINYSFSGICSRCGKICNFKIFMVGSCLSVFFIPLFTFGKRYIVRVNCCESVFELNKEIGKRLEKKEDIAITESDLIQIGGDFNAYNCCSQCGYELKPDFQHCPKCGKKL
ncbi:MAG: zinc-ribbon domain-containing protein [Anaerotignaceae bacterium]